MSSRNRSEKNALFDKWKVAARLQLYLWSFPIIIGVTLLVVGLRLWDLAHVIPVVFQENLQEAIRNPKWTSAIQAMVWDSLKVPIFVCIFCLIVLILAPILIPTKIVKKYGT